MKPVRSLLIVFLMLGHGAALHRPGEHACRKGYAQDGSLMSPTPFDMPVNILVGAERGIDSKRIRKVVKKPRSTFDTLMDTRDIRSAYAQSKL